MAERVNILKTDYEMNRTDWTEVVSAVFGGMLRVQEAIEMYVAKGQAWNVDFHTKKIKIVKKHCCITRCRISYFYKISHQRI